MRLGASFASRTKGARPSRTRDWRPWHCLPRPFLAPILGLFWATSFFGRSSTKYGHPAHLHCLQSPLLPPAPAPTASIHLHAHLSSRTHHESAAAPSCLFWLVPDACFHTGATSAARSQAMLAGLVPLCNWGRSHIRPTQRPKHARHGARHGAQRRPNTGPTAHTCLEHTPCWAHSARGK